MKKLLIVTDLKAGHENQSKAFARALGCEAEVREVRFGSRFKKALSYLYDRLGIFSESLFQGEFEIDFVPSAIIGTGSGTFYAAKVLARKYGVKCGVVLYPRGYDLSTFDCVMAPLFDRPSKRDNVIEIPANLVANDESFYDLGVENFKKRVDFDIDAPAVAVIIGGPNKCSTMTKEWVKSELRKIFEDNGSDYKYWVTTSRRTPKEVEEVVESFPFDYKLIYSCDHFNPIPAFVKKAKRLYVTAESTGMLSEACTFGTAEVFAMDNLKAGNHKFRVFVENLRAGNYLNGSRKVDLTEEFAKAKKLLDLGD